ncbi:hypothetical protein MIND_01125900 [Mycena indigotica]|uniref:RRM domain-containing protein n=1 Tax=Mycena indigotica TaxID=2126181 RepID=A0A8H6S6W0_9AGAR|nr:uncharacterized protein MIND_01125900 [Mycena indigotica]KAF7293482.1 hypothetical protein MIND_01125900 [Mycena indigotica]
MLSDLAATQTRQTTSRSLEPDFATVLCIKPVKESYNNPVTVALANLSPHVAPAQQSQSSPVFAPHLPEPVEKAPNVYINGFPPDFPEDQLIQLAVPFGTVQSVRSFTRHVGSTVTGYVFVLSTLLHLQSAVSTD